MCCRVAFEAVAVSAINRTVCGTMLLRSPISEKAFRKVSPLCVYTHCGQSGECVCGGGGVFLNKSDSLLTTS